MKKKVLEFKILFRRPLKKFNDEHMVQLDGEEFILEAVHIHQTMKKYAPKVDKNTGRIGQTSPKIQNSAQK